MSDIPANQSTNTILTVGSEITSEIGSNGDRDWVRIDLAPGEWVEVTQTSNGLADPYMRLYDGDGNLLDLDDDIVPGINLNSSLVFGGGDGGTYYVEAGSFGNSGIGSYTLSATAASAPSGSPLDVIEPGSQLADNNSNVVTVFFVQSGQANFSNITSDSGADIVSEGWDPAEMDRVIAALEGIEAIANIDFQVTLNPNANFQLVLDDNEFGDRGALGYFYLPNSSGQAMGAFNSNGYGWDADGLQEGGLGYSTIVHELLHGLGLSHPHADRPTDDAVVGVSQPFSDYGVNGLNQGIFGIMSYNGGWSGGPNTDNNSGDSAGPMALDIAAIQEAYGANTNHNNGNSVYNLDGTPGNGTAWEAIWDTGGTDTITYSGSRDTIIDLREATLDYGPGGGGYVSNASGVQGGFTIAAGVIIENATGGTGNDTLIGNTANNTLTGNNGNDLLIGGDGEDTLNGNNNNDTLLGGADDDTINGGGGNDAASGGSGDDDINAGSGNDAVDGNSGSDDIETSGGTNTIYGGSGFDTIDGGSGVDTIHGGSGDDTINGGNSSDFLFGGRGDDDINGGSGNDDITGGMGADELTGGTGADDFIFEFVSDSSVGNGDTITDFEVGIDDIDLTNFGGLSFAGDITLDISSGGDTTVQIDVNGDDVKDIEFLVENVMTLTASDFIL